MNLVGEIVEIARMPLDPVCLPGGGRQEWQPHEPLLARLPELSFAFERFRFRRHAFEFLRMNEGVALRADESAGCEFGGAALAVADEFGSNGHDLV